MARRIYILLIIILVFGGAYFVFPAKEGNEKNQITVFAASSFAYVLREEAPALEKALGADPLIVEGASSTLSRQIAGGAPADIFISADEIWLKEIREKGLTEGPGVEIADNTLVLVLEEKTYNDFCRVQFFAPPSAADLLAACPFRDRVATGDTDYTPLGKYAREALDFSGLDLTLLPAGSAAGARAFLETGAARAGILYATDAKALGPGYLAFPFSENSHQPIRYYAVALQHSESPAKENFLAFLKSEAFKAILKTRGFETD